MKDFARLFNVDGVGQILAVTHENDDGHPCLRFRIPDFDGMVLEMSVSSKIEDYDVAEAAVHEMLAGLTAELAHGAVEPLLRVVSGFREAQARADG